MNYCENCMLLTEGERCVRCNRRKLRAPRPGDFCLLDERPAMWAGMLMDVLGQNGIPCVTRSALGAALSQEVGHNLERQRVFVPYEQLDEARELVRELFGDG
ncbi:MAG TPA: DUF2007 domain-containing protein [Candidatus Fimadaptatus faecigallinarum]|uniref:DUF2007 domain-containing protein n=1 Tax=Candidatus Fimadaptatus faecigallinarum TaxID=2840814 RepID=A0A9D1S441_9FIRM|nr:DUF2007 domain-containing protein [Candidatus Fimadaptatus faecigallinarum]